MDFKTKYSIGELVYVQNSNTYYSVQSIQITVHTKVEIHYLLLSENGQESVIKAEEEILAVVH